MNHIRRGRGKPLLLIHGLGGSWRTWSPVLDGLAAEREVIAFGPAQQGANSTPGPVVIGWGRKDRLTLPRQAKRAMERFPNARLYWFEESGHYTHWDAPEETVRLILASTG